MSKIDAYKEKAEAQIDEQVAKLEQIKAQAAGGVADAKIDGHGLIEDLEAKIAEAKTRLAGIVDAGEDALEDVKEGFESAWKDLSSAVGKAFDRLS